MQVLVYLIETANHLLDNNISKLPKYEIGIKYRRLSTRDINGSDADPSVHFKRCGATASYEGTTEKFGPNRTRNGLKSLIP